ncbi:MAG: hypothetical protein AABX30_03175 [Nanoarchaeota archaeon]
MIRFNGLEKLMLATFILVGVLGIWSYDNKKLDKDNIRSYLSMFTSGLGVGGTYGKRRYRREELNLKRNNY